jgi:hypothetical protein
MVILENLEKKIKFGLITTKNYMLQNLIVDSKRNAISDVGRINCSSFSNRAKEEAGGTTAPAVPSLAVLTAKRAP